MINKEILKKQIVYRSTHRGSKEMDVLLGKFVKKYINDFDEDDLINIDKLVLIEDEILYRWYFYNISSSKITPNKVSKMLKKFNL